MRRELMFTVLRRKGGSWDERMISLLIHNLLTEAVSVQAMPEYLGLIGRYERQQILDAMGGGGWVGEPLQYIEATCGTALFDKIRVAEKSAPEEADQQEGNPPTHFVDRAGVDDFDGSPDSSEES